jgi:cephalosporin hydroxylase
MNDTITFEFFGLKSPYTRFDKNSIPKYSEIKNWQYPDSVMIFEKFISNYKPKLIIEIGTFLGWSAITMGSICKKYNLDTKILCVDTWLGSVEHWRVDLCNELKQYDFFQNGTSIMFDNFCKNVISHELENYIIPIPNTSNIAYQIFNHYNIKAELIYIDGDHSYEGVLNDLKLYFNILNSGGIIFGDDVCWEDVNKASLDFSKIVNHVIEYSPNKNLYYIKK